MKKSLKKEKSYNYIIPSFKDDLRRNNPKNLHKKY